jgi:hypothetical protein
LEGNQNIFEDKNLRINNKYTYQFQLVLKGGVKNKLSKPIILEY